MAHNVSRVCDAAPSLTEARGRCGGAARRSAAEPEAPSEAPMHIHAVMRSAMAEQPPKTSVSLLFRARSNHDRTAAEAGKEKRTLDVGVL